MIPACSKKASQEASSISSCSQQVVDRPVVEAQLRPVLLDEGAVGGRAVVLDRDDAGAEAWSSRQVAVCTAFQSETAWRTLLARTTRTKVRSGKTVGEQLGQRHVAVGGDVADEADEVAEVAPHQLRAEDAVRGRPRLEDPFEVAVVGGAAPERRARRLLGADPALAEVVADRLVLDAEEVFLRAARPAGVAERLEVLLGAAGDAGFAERVADQGASRFGAWRRRCRSGLGVIAE